MKARRRLYRTKYALLTCLIGAALLVYVLLRFGPALDPGGRGIVDERRPRRGLDGSCAGLLSSRRTLRSPTPTSAWVLDGVLAIGAEPGRRTRADNEAYDPDGLALADVDALVDANLTTLVSLIGEHARAPYGAHALARHSSVQLVHFPIKDYGTVPLASLVPFVRQLATRIAAHEERVFVHCRGGHGRTALVAVPLVATLCGVSAERARRALLAASRAGRADDALRDDLAMPETAEQWRVARDAVAALLAAAQPSSLRGGLRGAGAVPSAPPL